MKRFAACVLAFLMLCSLIAGCGIRKEPESTVEAQENDSATFTVHAYVPASWGTPNIWAWSEYVGDAFDSWPGAAMQLDEDGWYSCEVPLWASNVVINGVFGLVQTEDMHVQSREVWINVYKNGTATFAYQYFEPVDAGYIPEIKGEWDEYGWVLDQTVCDCTQMTVTMRVLMDEDTSCKEWQVWGRSDDGGFYEIGTIAHLATAGYSHITQTLYFPSPVTLDAIAIIPADPTGFAGIVYEVYDFYTS